MPHPRTGQARAAGMDGRPTKEECLQHYATREPTYFVQLDGFDPGDDFMGTDDDGQTVTGVQTYELMSGTPAVRVLVRPGYPKERILMLLDKLRAWAASDVSPLDPGMGYAEQFQHVRTTEELARDIFESCDLDHGSMVSLEAVLHRMRPTMDSPSRELVVEAIEHLEREGKVWCLYDREGTLHGYRMNPDDDSPF